MTLITGFLGAGKVEEGNHCLFWVSWWGQGACARSRYVWRATARPPPNDASKHRQQHTTPPPPPPHHHHQRTHHQQQTTLVRHILTARHGARVAVILNEFGGEGDIEAAFVRDAAGGTSAVPEWVELANGCLCCSVKAEFLQALEALVAPGSAHAGKFDAVLVETTGLADPGPIVGARLLLRSCVVVCVRWCA